MKEGSKVAFVRKLGAASVSSVVLAGLLMSSPAYAATTNAVGPKNTLGEFQTGAKFLRIAYTWKTAWYGGGPSIGKRDAPYTTPVVDRILNNVYVGPDAMANTTSWTVGTVTANSGGGLPHNVIFINYRISINHASFTETATVREKHGKNGWKVVGARLPAGQGPSSYCVNSPASRAHCDIYPPGSN